MKKCIHKNKYFEKVILKDDFKIHSTPRLSVCGYSYKPVLFIYTFCADCGDKLKLVKVKS